MAPLRCISKYSTGAGPVFRTSTSNHSPSCLASRIEIGAELKRSCRVGDCRSCGRSCAFVVVGSIEKAQQRQRARAISPVADSFFNDMVNLLTGCLVDLQSFNHVSWPLYPPPICYSRIGSNCRLSKPQWGNKSQAPV